MSLEEFAASVSALLEGCIALHEWFVGLVDVGFTEDQALSLIAKTVVESNRGNDADA